MAFTKRFQLIATFSLFYIGAVGQSVASPQPAPVAPVDVEAPGKKPPRPVTERSHSLGAAVTSPLEDLNLKRTDIPEVLVHAVEQPYDMKGLTNCRAVGAEIGRLDAVLGPDRDEPPPERRATTAGDVARAGAEAVTPYRGLVRRLTGASKHQARLQEAINAGGARRGYLKGMGMRMNCAPPAAPSWFKPAPPPPPPVRPTPVPPPKPAVATIPRPATAAARPKPAPAPAKPAPRTITITLPSWWPQ